MCSSMIGHVFYSWILRVWFMGNIYCWLFFYHVHVHTTEWCLKKSVLLVCHCVQWFTLKCLFIFSNVCDIVIYNNRYHKFWPPGWFWTHRVAWQLQDSLPIQPCVCHCSYSLSCQQVHCHSQEGTLCSVRWLTNTLYFHVSLCKAR